MSEFLLLKVHGGGKAYLGRGRVGKGGQKSETSKQAPTRKTKAAEDRRRNNRMLIKAVSVRHCAATIAPRNCCPTCYAEQSHKDNVCSSTETTRLFRDGEEGGQQGGGMEVREEGDYIPILYTLASPE